MPITLFEATMPSFIRHLTALSVLLDKAATYAEERKFDQRGLIEARLYPDMYNLAGQVQTATDQAKGGAARVAGIEVPRYEDNEKTLAELKTRIEKTIGFLNGITPA
ncbi:MAG: DUF1993 family protein, partial [Stellaceae bacterium]